MTETLVNPAVSFSALDGNSLFSLATVVNYPLGKAPVIDPFQLIGVLEKSQYTATAQGLVGVGTLLSDGTTVAVVVMGWQWQKFLENYPTSYHVLSPFPFTYPNMPTQPPPSFDYGYGLQYQLFRNSLWNLIRRAKETVEQFQVTMPLVTVGFGPSAPLAQLAALDLQPGNSYQPLVGPKITSPITSVACYAYSCPAAGDASFAASYNQCVPATYLVNLTTAKQHAVDVYPTISGSPGDGYTEAGQEHGLAAALPEFICPWLEREWYTYGNALQAAEDRPTGQQAPGSGESGTGGGVDTGSIEPPSLPGYDPILAYNFTLLCSAVYSLYEHPGLPLDLPEPYSLVQSFTDDHNAIWAALFAAPKLLVVAFRGPDTWAETNAVFGDTTVSVDPPGVINSYLVLLGKMQPAIRAALKAAGTSSQTVHFTGHCGGGCLASLALYDLVSHPLNPLVTGQVYTYGAPPAGDTGFSLTFNAACGSKSFQIARPQDIFPKLYSARLRRVGTSIALYGGLADLRNCFTYHTLAVYSALLNPYPRGLTGEAPLHESAEQTYRQGLKSRQIGWNDVHKCTIDTAHNQGRIVLTWDQARSWAEPVRYAEDGTAFVGVQDIVVRAGHELRIEAPHGQQMQVVARSVRMAPGSRLIITTECKLLSGELRAIPGNGTVGPPSVVVLGTNGVAGPDGGNGAPGVNGGYDTQGGPGGNGSAGGAGSSGGPCPHVALLIDTLSGVFSVICHGGTGGSGGNGGSGGQGGKGGWTSGGRMTAGGAGGSGGFGGAGGNGGSGGTVTIAYKTIEPGTEFIFDTSPAQGGAGGQGGASGNGGVGTPPGPPGTPGAMGSVGTAGTPSEVILQKQP